MYTKFYLIIFALLLIGCEEEKQVNMVEPVGTMYSTSEKSMDETYADFKKALEEKEPVSITAEVDYAANARFVERQLRPSKNIFFANPALGTPLLQKNQLAGLDLPYHVYLFEQDEDVHAMYNSIQYLEARYELQGTAALEDISTAVENLTKAATASKIRKAPEQTVGAGEGIITVLSEQDFGQTYLSLQEGLTGNVDWMIVAEVDHQANATAAGMELRPTRLFIIANADLETTLLGTNPTAGLDFPQKILVWQDVDGSVKISYNNPVYLQQRHQIQGGDIELAEISSTLKDLTQVATTKTERYKGDVPMEGGDNEANF